MTPEPAPGAHLLERIAGFGRHLRAGGIPVGLGQVMDLARAVPAVGLRREDFRLAARATLLTRPEDASAFDAAFDSYWRGMLLEGERGPIVDNPPAQEDDVEPGEVFPPDALPPQEPAATTSPATARRDAAQGKAGVPGNLESAPTYSAAEQLADKDFAAFTEQELAEAKRLMERIAWRVVRRSRRTVRAAKGPYPDPRRALRATLRSGEPLELGRRARKTKPRQIVAICDISGSMDRYSRLLLQFLHTLHQGPNPAEVFVFGTRLTRITRELRSRDVDAALAQVSREVVDWSGGTRIGECLHTFNTVWARRVLRRGVVVLLISDGWDRGDPRLLAREVARLQRGAHRLVWLNPLLGSPAYEPLTRGILAALPYVDDFLPVHNLRSLHALADALSDAGRQGAGPASASPPAAAMTPCTRRSL